MLVAMGSTEEDMLVALEEQRGSGRKARREVGRLDIMTGRAAERAAENLVLARNGTKTALSLSPRFC